MAWHGKRSTGPGYRTTTTIDTSRAERILKEMGRHFTKRNKHAVSRNAARMLRDDMRRGAGGIVPIWNRKSRALGSNRKTLLQYHLFSRAGYRVMIKRGNLRKAHQVLPLHGSSMLWVGPKYNKSGLNGRIIGTSYGNADGFYDKMYIAKTGNQFHLRALKRNETAVAGRLRKDTEQWLSNQIRRANGTN